MKNEKYTVAISCIGSGVGQSVINSLRLSRLPIRTLGLGVNPFAYGAYDCDIYDYTSNIYSETYVDELIKKCQEHSVDIIIPGLDDEALIYAQNAQKFKDAGLKAIYSDFDLISLCRDKERMSLELNELVNVFVKSYDRDTLSEDIDSGKVKFPFIAKPRGGFASRGIEIIKTKNDLIKIDEDHIIQELAIPHKNDPNREFYLSQIEKNKNPQVSEISIQLVYSPEGELMGRMASFNKLNNGVPIEVVPYDDPYMWGVVDQITPELLKRGLRGPINIQGRLTDEGLKLFEMNPRFTGITGLRALMGFNEVEACVKEWLGIDVGGNQLFFNHSRFGIRQTADKSVPIKRNRRVIELSEKLDQPIDSHKKVVFITGATGFVGKNLIDALSIETGFEVWAYGRDKNKTEKLLGDKVEKVFDFEDFLQGRIHFGNIETILHLGFARPNKTNAEIAESLAFTQKLFTRAVQNHVPEVINISSQSVYGFENESDWTEDQPVYPPTSYAMAKLASEQLLESMHEINKQFKGISLRLGTISGINVELNEVDFITKMLSEGLNKGKIKVFGGSQKVQRIDIKDAVKAIISVLKSDSNKWESLYNVGNNETVKLQEIIEDIKEAFKIYSQMDLVIEHANSEKKFGTPRLDSSKFEKDFDWQPTMSIKNTVNSMLEFLSTKK